MSLIRSSDRAIPRMRSLAQRRSSVVSVLDIGTTKVCCMIGRLRPFPENALLPGRTHRVEIVGYGLQQSRGMKAGVINDLDKMEHSVRMAVDAAERMSGLTVDSLVVNVSAGRLKSRTPSAEIEIGGREVQASDVRRVLQQAFSQVPGNERTIVHALPAGFVLDGETGIFEPAGMFGNALGVDLHAVTAERAPLRNIEICVNRAHLSVEAMTATPYASGLATLVDDETEMGCACIDMGGGTTTLSVFARGRFVHADAVAVGGSHVTNDLARGLSVSLEDAERLKTMHGSVLPVGADDRDLVPVHQVGEREAGLSRQLPRALITRVIRARVEETLELIRDRLNASGFAGTAGKRVVLTGGSSQLTGMGEAARRVLARNVRIGRPMGVSGLPDAAKSPAFSTVVGLMIYPQFAGLESEVCGASASYSVTGTGGRFAQLGQWLRESF